ncbi:MAG: hypothetical protein R3E32_24990 [Chitinophagales bacterium]
MESLTLKKFQDFEIEKIKLTKIVGGECTGGGFTCIARDQDTAIWFTWGRDDGTATYEEDYEKTNWEQV